MKLVDILAQELKAWPKNATHVVQDYIGPSAGIIYLLSVPKENTIRNESFGGWYLGEGVRSASVAFTNCELADDCRDAIVTREQWQAAVDALAANKPVIDWSKAPDWAGAVVEGAANSLFYVEQWGGISKKRQAVNSSEPDDSLADMEDPHGWTLVELRPAASEWNGEGLPPAGAECEVIPHNTQWGFSIITPYHCTILAYHDDFVWLDMSVPGVPVSTRVDKVDFRPIRTADQIAADEREAGIAGIRQTLISNAKGSIESAIWDAGYRKQVSP
ncbi:hypothetical protein JTA33_00390 [Pseudomonas sp. 20GA0080]|uniref:hypothetical protein n=1 Tax=Pseudomonas alliivorans TaxID=2810613 RepID=UPI001AE92A47|nr:hypothetical protein [Pseudomonas alliivorans]MBP0948906.1 hypothetical protein [Pseudomonas alliivorans]